MSLILDAFNRSRQDSERMPGLSSDHFVESAATGTNWVLWLLIGGLTCAVLAIGWLLLDRLPQPSPVVETTAKTVESAAPVALPAPAQPAAQPPPAASAVPERRRTAIELTAQEAPPATSRPIKHAPATPPPKSATAPVDPSVAELYQRRDEAAPAATRPPPAAAASVRDRTDRSPDGGPDEEPVDIEQLVESARAELADAQLSQHEVPLLSALSQQTKDGIPTLMYQRHDYSGNAAKSSVVINGKEVRAGGFVSGVKVLEILPDSVVLDYQGTDFRLRALNSWVNL